MNYSSRLTITSKVAPGVTYTLRRMSHARRSKYKARVAAPIAKQIDLQREWAALSAQKEALAKEARIEPCSCGHPDEGHDKETRLCGEPGCKCRVPTSEEIDRRISEIASRYDEITVDELYPEMIRCALDSISGFKIGGVAPDAELLIEDGPEVLIWEIASEVSKLLQVTPLEAENFESPSTSGAQADGQTSDSSAPIAGATSST